MVSIGKTNTLAAMLLRHIRYFLAVAEQCSFTRAADALHVSQPTLSQQVRQLEETLGVQLFDRSGRTVRLTEFGEVYARHARARCTSSIPGSARCTMSRISVAVRCGSR